MITKELFLEYLPYIIGLIVLALSYFGLQSKYRKQVAAALLYFVIKAEADFGGETGELKKSAVSAWIYERLPSFARFFLSEAMISKMIDDAVIYMKKYLAENSKAQALVLTSFIN